MMINSSEYRVVKTAQGFFEIHEVYYDKEDSPVTSSVYATRLREVSVNELKSKLKLIKAAFSKPVLDVNSIGK